MEDIKGTNDEDDKSKDMEEHSKESQRRLGFDQEEERMVSKSIIFLERERKKIEEKIKKKIDFMWW
jgi:hypothetical protein